ncbi:MAG TPA: hypothetical protein V6C99_02740 [Oculatellaceae cyanobacterium]|jgi:hypothetical protein
MQLDSRQFLETLHLKSGQLLVLSSRLLAMVLALGAFCSLVLLGGLLMTRHPEQVFQLESFQINYQELNRSAEPETWTSVQLDPAWDGALVGFGLGVEVGRMVPVIGVVAGPVFGAVLGYQLDKQIQAD